MALKKWGEVKNERGTTGALIGIIIGGLVGYLASPSDIKIIGLIIGAIIVGILGHGFDPLKTVIYKEEIENNKLKNEMSGKRSLVKVSPTGKFFHCPFCNASLKTQDETQCPECKKSLVEEK